MLLSRLTAELLVKLLLPDLGYSFLKVVTRCQPQRLPSMVRIRSSLRAAQYASLLALLLSACNGVEVRTFPLSAGTKFSLLVTDLMISGCGKLRACATKRSGGIFLSPSCDFYELTVRVVLSVEGKLLNATSVH